MINLLPIASLFEQMKVPSLCPCGPGWCGNQKPCPLHDDLVDNLERNREFLTSTVFSVFVEAPASAIQQASRQPELNRHKIHV